jgi:hypothetical protein
MPGGQILNTIFAILGLASSLFIIFSITIRTINRTIENKIDKMEKDLLKEIDKKMKLNHAHNR